MTLPVLSTDDHVATRFPREAKISFAALVARQRAFFECGATRPLEFRRQQLTALSTGLAKHENALLAALYCDLGKSSYQGYASELALVHAELRAASRNLRPWSARSRRRTPSLSWPARAWCQPEPLGVALIFAPWNYPLQLLLSPLVSALAAGNCVVLKPSELAPRTSEAVAAMLQESFADEYVSVVEGGREIAIAVLRERFDKIFFTGSEAMGRKVMAAAAQHLTPVTLELGGKCPAIVCADADLETAARRIAWGKFLNAGQTCVAPDFVFVQRDLRARCIEALKRALHEFYGDDPAQSVDYGRIINRRHFERLTSYLSDGTIVHGGGRNARELFLAPTILTGVAPEAPVMAEEIFGPILPVLDFGTVEEVLRFLRARPAPLAVYLFTRDRDTEARVLAETRSGGVCVNDVIVQMLGTDLPFGGVGASGMGVYHGRAGFDVFSSQRTVMRRATWPDFSLRYPPQRLSLARLKRALRFLLHV